MAIQAQRNFYLLLLLHQQRELKYLTKSAEPLEALLAYNRKTMYQKIKPLPSISPNDIIRLVPEEKTNLQNNLCWKGCKEQAILLALDIIKRHRDKFENKGLRNPIHGCRFGVDTEESIPI